MGKWLYINLTVVLISIIFMFVKFSDTYDAGWLPYFLGSIFWLSLLACGYFIYVYRINRTATTKSGAVAAKPTINTAKPKVQLNRPKVNLKKEKNQQNDER